MQALVEYTRTATGDHVPNAAPGRRTVVIDTRSDTSLLR